jgi:RimJ/RimL family protein N-acetyltransferase
MSHQSDLTTEMSERFLRLQLELECTRIVPGDLLAPFSCEDPDPPARVLVVRYESAYALYLRKDLPFTLRERLRELGPERAFSDGERIQAVLAEDAPCEEIWSGVAYIFPSSLASTLSGWGIGKGSAYGVIVDGCLVSSCTSSRQNTSAAEAWVVTEPEYRQRGFARQVVAAWARDLQRQGKTPFYTHRVDNLASRAVAHSLGLTQVFATVGYS